MNVSLNKHKIDLSAYCNDKCIFCPFHATDKGIKKGDFIRPDLIYNAITDLRVADLKPTVRIAGSEKGLSTDLCSRCCFHH